MRENEGQDSSKGVEHAHERLERAHECAREGNDLVARNYIDYLRYEVAPVLEPTAAAELSSQLAALEEELLLPRRQRFREKRPAPGRWRRNAMFTCVFCRQRYSVAYSVEAAAGRRSCQACARSVMCPSCGRRKKDGYATCLRCSGDTSVSARPHGFHT